MPFFTSYLQPWVTVRSSGYANLWNSCIQLTQWQNSPSKYTNQQDCVSFPGSLFFFPHPGPLYSLVKQGHTTLWWKYAGLYMFFVSQTYLQYSLNVHHTAILKLSAFKGSALIHKPCFKSSVAETQHIHNPLIHVNMKGFLCSGLCESQCMWVWRGGGGVWCSRSGCTNFALRREMCRCSCF